MGILLAINVKKSSKMRTRSTYTTTACIQMKEFLVINVTRLSNVKAISPCTLENITML